MEAQLLLARCMCQWRRALAERQHVQRGRRMERLLKTLTVRENQSRGHVVAEATTESPLQPTPEPLPCSEADCPESPKQHTPPTPLPQPRHATLAANGGDCGGAVRLGEPALLDASGRPTRRGGRSEARRGGGGGAEPPGTESPGETEGEGEGAASTCRAASAMLGLSWRANSSRASQLEPTRPASLSPAATAAVSRTAAATDDADADDACAIRGACSLASAFEAAAVERPERPAGASADHDGSALELGLVALRRLINATPIGGSSSSGDRGSLASHVSEPESERQAASPASPSSPPPSSPPPSSPPPSSPPPSSPPPSCPPTAIRQPHDRGRVPAETPPQQGAPPRPRVCGTAAATATAVAGAGVHTGRDAAPARRGDGALLTIRLQGRADERRSRRLEMQHKQQQAQQASKAAAEAAQAVQAAREVAARRERAAEVRAEREATDRKRELLVYRAKQARQPSPYPPSSLFTFTPPPPPPSLARPKGLSPSPGTQALTMGAVPRCDTGATRRPARRARTSCPSRLAAMARAGARGGLQTARPHPKPPVLMHASRQIPSPPSERLPEP
jgi:hypothetical protein